MFRPSWFSKILQLHASLFLVFLFVFSVTSSEVWAGLLFGALKRQKLAKLPRGELKPFETEIYSLNETSAIWPP